MSKRTREEVRKAILEALSDGKAHSYGSLERKADTNWQTVRDHCKELEVFGAVEVSEEGVKITRNGREVLKKI
jgi:predicted transcriptional regulator